MSPTADSLSHLSFSEQEEEGREDPLRSVIREEARGTGRPKPHRYMSTGLTVGGWFISAVLDSLVDKASTYALQRIGLRYGLVYGDILRLQASLSKANFVLACFQKGQLILDKDLHKLLALFEGAIFDADDFLAELEYQHLAELDSSRSDDVDAGDLFPFSAFNTVIRFFLPGDDAGTEIRRIQDKLDIFTPDVKDFYLPVGKQVEIQETSSFLTTTRVFGREQEKDRIVQHLLNSGNKSGPLSIACIVGPPGVGKTTLAQLLCNDEEVKEKYKLCIWVSCGFEAFDVLKITRQMVESVSEEMHSELTNLDQVQKFLMKKLKGKRYLLALDGIWNDDESKWESLIAPLMHGSQGSMILGTTRSQKVADAMGVTYSIPLKGLSDESFWSLLKICTLGSRSSEDYPRLEAIVKKIAPKLMGSPLAARTLGNYLKPNVEVEQYWRTILETDLCELPQGENDFLRVSESSYWRLPENLKPCASFCSLFPKKHKFDKESLVQMWIALDFVLSEGAMRKEDVGSRYFDDLFHRSFFEKHDDYYIMDPILHEVLRYVSKDDHFTIKDGYSLSEIPSTVRHVSVQTPNIELSQFIDLCKNRKLRTLLFIDNFGLDLDCVLHELESEVRTIRVFDLGCCDIKQLPDNISNLKQLRYFDARGTRIEGLPESFCRLYKLQVLKVLNSSLVLLPGGLSKLINLRYVDALKFYASQIPRIGRLISLQELNHYEVLKNGGHMIEELKNMNGLTGKLCISNLENVESFDEAAQAKLNNKKHLDELTLKWASNRHASGCSNQHDVHVLEGLQPHSQLRVLEINSYGGSTNPSWLRDGQLPNLENVTFRNCSNLCSLPPELSMIKCLTLDNCPDLKSLPDNGLPVSLLSFHVKNCPDLKERCWKETGADWHKIPRTVSLCFDG